VAEEADGEALYKMYCIACHSSGKLSIYDEIFKRTIPAIMNPTFIKAIDDQYLKKMVEEGRTDTQMTAWKADAAGLTDREINKIVNYMTGARPEEESTPFGFSGFTSDAKRGGELFGVRCAPCHGKNGKGGEELLGIDLKNPIVQNGDPEFLAITVRDGRPGTPMAPFGITGLKLEDQDIADLVAYVKTLSQKK
jgi:mono/diheme cytochrome c family protein